MFTTFKMFRIFTFRFEIKKLLNFIVCKTQLFKKWVRILHFDL
jgi:hypothetical protein